MLQKTREEQKRYLLMLQKRMQARTPRAIIRDIDEVLDLLEECVLNEMVYVPGWILNRVIKLASEVGPEFSEQLRSERRPLQVMDILLAAQGQMMQKNAAQKSKKTVIIRLFD
jgi:hypothetical protein